ncbi:MAG: hypothetical protein NTX45_30060 [Proteobacteria bacterium]|nr:hypothetical protein [Pseudomonadota bacterium]
MTAQAQGESNDPKVTASGFLGASLLPPVLAPASFAIKETAGNTLLNLGSMGFSGAYLTTTANANAVGTTLGATKIFGFNIYETAAKTQLSDTLAVTLTRYAGNRITVNAAFLSDSLTGYLPPLLTTALLPGATIAGIAETGFVQQVFDQYGLQVAFRSDVPIPAALFFVAPALAGVFGFSRRKPAKAQLA